MGFNAGCLRFYNGATGSTAWAGTITSSPDSDVFSLTSSGASVRAAQPGGVDLGPSSGSNSVARYFYAAYQPIGTNTLSSTAFSYLTGSWDNPNGGFSYVTINGANYEQVFLGDLFFAVSGGTAGQTATINPAAVTTSLAGNTSFWMEDGTTYCGDASGGATVGTINTSGVTLAISGAVTQPGAVGISGSIAHSNLLFGGSASPVFTISNTSGNQLNDWSVSGSATVGTLALTGSGSLAANSSTTATGTYHAPTIAGPISNITQGSPVTGTISVTVNSTDTGVTPSPGSSSVTVNVGAASAPSSSAFSGGTLSGDVSNGASYTGLASVVTSGSGNLGTVAELLGGTNNSGATQTVTMAWRTRAPGEIPGTTTEPPMSNANKAGFLVSDVVQLAGTGTGNYVLEMSYDSSLLGGPAGEQTTAQDGWLFLATLHGGTWRTRWRPPVPLRPSSSAPTIRAPTSTWVTMAWT